MELEIYSGYIVELEIFSRRAGGWTINSCTIKLLDNKLLRLAVADSNAQSRQGGINTVHTDGQGGRTFTTELKIKPCPLAAQIRF